MKAPAPAAASRPLAGVTAVHELAPLVWLAMGTFATGTESFMIAALLPGLASDLAVSVTAAGQLMTVFALTYALSSPVLAAATAGIERRKLLLAAMAAFALANFVAASAADLLAIDGGARAARRRGRTLRAERQRVGRRRGVAAAARHGACDRHGRHQHRRRARRAARRHRRTCHGLARDLCRRRHLGHDRDRRSCARLAARRRRRAWRRRHCASGSPWCGVRRCWWAC